MATVRINPIDDEKAVLLVILAYAMPKFECSMSRITAQQRANTQVEFIAADRHLWCIKRILHAHVRVCLVYFLQESLCVNVMN